MTMMTVAAVPSSSSKRGAGLRGPRPQPLKVTSPPTSRPSKKHHLHGRAAAPVIVYEHTPKVVHARPQEFMTVVQRLTGRPPAAQATTSSMMMCEPAAAAGYPLLLTLGQRQAAPPLPPPVPSPMAAAVMLMSPGFIFSPNTMQSIQELSTLF